MKTRTLVNHDNWMNLREIRKIIEYRQGCVYRTKHVKIALKGDYILAEDEVEIPLSSQLVGEVVLVSINGKVRHEFGN